MEKLISYARECRKRGFKDEYIIENLRNAGYQDAIIKQALYGAGYPKAVSSAELLHEQRNIRSVLKPVIAVIMVLAVGVSVLGIFTALNDNFTGMAVEVSKDDAVKLAEATSLIEAKNRVISEQIEKINLMDISLEEKQALIVEKTAEIEELFRQVESERKETVKSAVELINAILSRPRVQAGQAENS
jgi:hypothetical protein